MLIVCPSCTTSYRIEGASLGPSGRSVRCVRCRNVWFARDPGALSAIAEAHRSDVEALVGSGTGPATGEERVPSPSDPFALPAASHTVTDPLTTAPAPAPSSIEGAGAEPEVLPIIDEGPEAQPVTMTAPALAPIEQVELPAMDDSLPARALPTTIAPIRRAKDIESFAAEHSIRRNWRGHRARLTALVLAIVALAALDAALLGWRTQVVRAAPQTASLYAAIGLPVNLRGLTFKDVRTSAEIHDGVQVLIVEGNIASVSRRTVEVPRMRFSVRNKAGQEIYAWTALPERSVISPSETLAFRSRLASPPHGTHDILVRFLNRRDLVASSR